jgi:hypothetical protein
MDFLLIWGPKILVFALFALAGWAFHRFAGHRKDALRAAARAALEQRFGPQMEWANGRPARLDAQGYALLRQPATLDDVVRIGSDAALSWDVIVRVQDRYAHVLISGRCQLWGDMALQLAPLAVTELTELRARRALFNDAKAYQRAFGQAPDRKQLASLEPKPRAETDL